MSSSSSLSALFAAARDSNSTYSQQTEQNALAVAIPANGGVVTVTSPATCWMSMPPLPQWIGELVAAKWLLDDSEPRVLDDPEDDPEALMLDSLPRTSFSRYMILEVQLVDKESLEPHLPISKNFDRSGYLFLASFPKDLC